MFAHALETVRAAEETAARTGDVNAALAALRRLGLDDFGQFVIGLPDPSFPRLSALLPAMAAEEIQTKWTGSSGVTLLRQTLAFTWIVRERFHSLAGRPAPGARILDFGCGYGRILRLMYYFSDPDRIFGVDAWDRSLDICRSDRVLGTLARSEPTPEALPVADGSIDLAYAFSVFTHLAEPTARAAFAAVRRAMAPDGVFFATVRPAEFWQFRDQAHKTGDAPRCMADHAAGGFAYVGHNGPEGATYGDASISFDWLRRLPGWRFAGYERSLLDPYQVVAALRPC